ncbi:branched-chain amino acid ABC transporter ATP-binding protein [Candidatus Heimdallarchaeota archaeon B3_Heim]|nr:MAG: branched-chain amino acid ABC transporter ATP-binding protein [Candidatus Heimdallarchaeota archaeon B3_Heim]
MSETNKQSSTLFELQEASVHYGRAIAIASVSLTVEKGELVAVIGPNGTGKTTLLRAISGLVELERGKVFFEGKKILESTKSEFRVMGTNKSLKPHRIVELGIIHCPERRRLFTESSVRENLILGAYTNKDKLKVEQTLEYVLKLFPVLEKRLNEKAGNFSGGEQQMIAIGRSLMGNPKLLLLDEPSLGLAPMVKRNIVEAIRKIQERGTTILLVEQDASIALEICDRGYLLEDGRLELEGSRDELLKNPYVKEAYLGIA